MKPLNIIVLVALSIIFLMGCIDSGIVHKHRFFSISQSQDIPVSVLVYSKNEPVWSDVENFVIEHSELFDHRVAESPVGWLNQHGQASLPQDILDVVKISLDVAKETNGAFDPTILPLVKLWDFSVSMDLPKQEDIDKARQFVDYRRLELSNSGMAYLPEGFSIDLGGVAKGAIVDELADEFYLQGFTDFLIEAGGDIIISGTKADKAKWSVAVRHPRKTEYLLVKFYLGEPGKKQAIVTSGDYERFIIKDGIRYHHLLDPETGWPAMGCASVTVIAPNCTLADALSTAAFVLGPEKGLEYLEKKAYVEGLIIEETADGKLKAATTSGFPVAAEDIIL